MADPLRIIKRGPRTTAWLGRELRGHLAALPSRPKLLLNGRGAVAAPRPGRQLRAHVAYLLSNPTRIYVGLMVVACVAIALPIGRLLAGDRTSPSTTPISTRVVEGHLALSGWIGWNPGRAPSAVTALVPGATVVEPGAMAGVTVVFGDLPSDGVPKLFSTLGLLTSSSEELAAGSLRARAYVGRLEGSERLSVTALLIPSAAGASTAICLGDTGTSPQAADDCRKVLTTTVDLHGSEPAAASPQTSDVAELRSAINDFDAERNRDAAALTAAPTASRQANAALQLSGRYETAAKDVSAIGLTQLASASGRSLIAHLTAGAAAYRALAEASDNGSAAGFRTARAQATAADAKIRAALDELGALGYGNR